MLVLMVVVVGVLLVVAAAWVGGCVSGRRVGQVVLALLAMKDLDSAADVKSLLVVESYKNNENKNNNRRLDRSK